MPRKLIEAAVKDLSTEAAGVRTEINAKVDEAKELRGSGDVAGANAASKSALLPSMVYLFARHLSHFCFRV